MMLCGSRLLRWWLIPFAVVGWGAGLAAQGSPAQGTQKQGNQKQGARTQPGQGQSPVQEDRILPKLTGLGKEIADVRIVGLKHKNEAVILSSLLTRKGKQLTVRKVSEDLNYLWQKYKVRTKGVFTRLTGDKVSVVFDVDEFATYRQIEFRGFHFMDVPKVRDFLGLQQGEELDEFTAQSDAQRLEAHYRDEGYQYVSVKVEGNRARNTLTFRIDEGPRMRVRSIRFIGNKAFSESAILGLWTNLLGTAGVVSRPGVFSDEPYSKRKLEADVDRLRAFYRGRGYRDAEVDAQDIRPHPDGTGVDITIRITEGHVYRVSAVDIEQIPPAGRTEPVIPKKKLLAVIHVRPGQIYSRERVSEDEARIVDYYGKRGFPDYETFRKLDPESSFQVLETELVDDPERHEVKVVYRVREGKRKRIREISIRGNQYTRDAVIRRELSLFPGQYLDMVEYRKSLARLNSLQYFGNPEKVQEPGVQMILKSVPGQPDFVDLEVKVVEGRTGQFLFGAGINSARGLFGTLTYRKRNFDWTRPPTGLNPIGWFEQIFGYKAFHGGGQSLTLNLQPGTQDSFANVSFYEPDLFGTHLETIGMHLDAWKSLRFFEVYDVNSTGASVRLQKNIGRELSFSGELKHERVNIENIQLDAPSIVWDAEGKETIRSIGFDARFLNTDFALRPTTGLSVSTTAELAPSWLGSGDRAQFWKAGIDTHFYIPVYRDSKERSHVLLFRNSFSVGRNLKSGQDLYLTERFYMGGQTTMPLRGFRLRGAGPSQFGHPTGGEMLYSGSVEYSFPIFSTPERMRLQQLDILRGVLFTDYGMLGDNINDDQFRQIRLSAGFGLRFVIPGLGNLPIAFDFGWPIRREQTDRTRTFHFSLRLQ